MQTDTLPLSAPSRFQIVEDICGLLLLDDCFGRSEYREHNPTDCVDCGGRTEDCRPTLGQLQDVAGQVDAQETCT